MQLCGPWYENSFLVTIKSYYIDTVNITFSDIQVAESTSAFLKLVVEMPLKFGNEFSYGVLSKNFINGVLLYGPPGTGKTMIAKAIAKECDVKMLHIKGSDVYAKYVGEAAKTIKVRNSQTIIFVLIIQGYILTCSQGETMHRVFG